MTAENFRKKLVQYFSEFAHTIATNDGDWVVKGFIDAYRNIYTISIDTKVVSKIIELLLFPLVSRFAADNGLRMVLSEHQNHYPDISFVGADKTKFAIDLRSTYRTGPDTVNGFTLGAFTGYFRQRKSTKNVTFPYEQYTAHFVLGVIYSRQPEAADERRIYALTDLQNIMSVVKDFDFLLQEKWRIASDRPGSGNTKNIGSIKNIQTLIEGNGPFANHSQEVFDDYWMNFLTPDMARAIDSEAPYRSLKEYFEWRDRAHKKNRRRS